MDEFSIREATQNDKEDVLAIHDNVYAGFDYLPQFYDHFMSAKNSKSFVLLHGEKIIGFNSAFLLDDGDTVVSRAARINPDYEGKGLYRNLDQYLIAWAKSQGVSIKAQTSTHANPAVTKPSFQKQNKLIVSKDTYIYFFESDGIHLCESDEDTTKGLAAASADVLTTYIHSEALSKYLFPHGRVIVDFVPFRLIDSNVPFMTEPSKFLEVFSDVRTEADAYKGLLSFGSIYKVKAVPYKYSLDIYGTDCNSLKVHLVKHLMRMKQKATGTTAFVVTLNETFRSEIVEEILKQLGGTKAKDDPDSGYFTQQFLFEKHLQIE